MKHPILASRGRLLTLVAGASMLATTAVTLASAQAQPRQAPAIGARRDDDRGWDRRDTRRDDRGWDQRDTRRDGRLSDDLRFDTLRGVVDRRRNSRDFDVRFENRIVRVRSVQEVEVRPGDLVILVGDWQSNNSFDAYRVGFSDGRPGAGGPIDSRWRDRYPGASHGTNTFHRDVDFPGSVTRRRSDFELDVRGDNGASYRIVSRTRFDRNLRVGDRIRVRGTFDGSRVTEASVDLLRETGSSSARNFDFPARIEFVDRFRREMVVRGDNGQTYTVRLTQRDADNLRAGQRVRVQGTQSGNDVVATPVRAL